MPMPKRQRFSAQAHSQDPDFYEFLRSIDALKAIRSEHYIGRRHKLATVRRTGEALIFMDDQIQNNECV